MEGLTNLIATRSVLTHLTIFVAGRGECPYIKRVSYTFMCVCIYIPRFLAWNVSLKGLAGDTTRGLAIMSFIARHCDSKIVTSIQ